MAENGSPSKSNSNSDSVPPIVPGTTGESPENLANPVNPQLESENYNPPPSQTTGGKMKWVWTIMIIFIFIVIIAIAQSYKTFKQEISNGETVGPNVERIQREGKIVIGTDATFPPMEYIDELGNLVGYDIDLGTKLAEEMKVSVEFQDISWDEVFSALEDGRVDIIISSVTINDERKQIYDFSDHYLNAGQVIITRKDNSLITSTSNLTGKKIAVQKDTTNYDEAIKYTSEENVLTYDDFMEATEALLAQEVDAIFSDLTGARGIIDANPELKIASEPFTSDLYGIVFRKGESDLVEKVNSTLNLLRQRGVLVFLQQKWLE
jgi:ABC-type amino acid transport substrate-binding protein